MPPDAPLPQTPPEEPAAPETPASETPRGAPFEFSAEGGLTRVMTERGPIWTLRGPVRVTYREYVITADRATYEEASEQVEFVGNVTLVAPERTVTGEALRLNLKTREWTFQRGRTALTPEYLEQGILSPIYVQSEEVSGAPGIIELSRSAATTCDLDDPHYEVRARHLEVYPGDRLVAKGATLYAFGRRVLPLANLVVPLRERRLYRGYLPEVGQSELEGYYVKAARPYRAGGNDGLLKLDLLSRRGIGLGADQTYRLFGGAGTLLLYGLIPRAGIPAEASGRLQHRQQWGSLSGTLTADYRRSEYRFSTAPNVVTTSFGTDLNLLRQTPGGTTTALNLHQDQTRSGSTFSNLTVNIAHSQRFTATLSGDFGLDYLMSRFPGARTGQLNSRLELRERSGTFDLTLAANDTEPLGDATGTTTGLERQPEFIIATDTLRLRRGKYARSLPARLSLSVGRFLEGPGGIDEPRALFDFSLQNKEWFWGDSSFRVSGGFRQAFYGGGGAQYVISANPTLTWALGRESSFILSHFYQNAAGFTPFRFDFPFDLNRIEGTLALKKGDRLGLGVRTGFDFNADPRFRWQNVTLHARWMPTSTSLLTLGTSYNLNDLGPVTSPFRQKRLQTVIGEFRVRVPGGLRLDLGARYDPARDGFPAAKGQIDTTLGRHWRLVALVGYDGFSRFNDLMLVRDLHCWELALIRVDHRDWRREEGWRLMLRLKAFPPFEQFGIGGTGQGIDTSVGQIY